MTIDITLAFPAYNESAVLPKVLERAVEALDALNASWEILVIDNASSDSTPDVVTRAGERDDRIRLVQHDENRLYSGSCATAIREARGAVIAIVDSDGQADIGDLPLFLAQLELGANLVIGWRHERKDGLARKLMSMVFNLLGKIYLRYPHHDLNCGFRVFDRSVASVAQIEYRINLANPELYVRATTNGLRTDEVKVRHYPREGGGSSHDFKRLGRVFRGTNAYMRSLRREMKHQGQ